MNDGQLLLEELVTSTVTECERIIGQNDAAAFAERSMAGVRLFYPVLQQLKDRDDISYSNRCTGWGSPTLLQELLLGTPALVDLYDCPDLVTFRRTYGMSPGQMTDEIGEGRLIPVINASDPQRWSPEALSALLPILKSGKVQMAHWRTEAFQNWFSRGKVADIRKRGSAVFDEYFTCKPDEQVRLYRRLRIHKYKNPAEAYKNVVVGRWRNIISIFPQVESPFLNVLHDLRDRPAVVRAEVLNGVKNLVSSPISAARGGIYRASPQQVREIAKLSEYKKLSPALESILISDVARDFWTPTLKRWLEKTSTLPLPQHLNFDRYQQLIGHRHWPKFRDDVQRLLSLLSKQKPDIRSLKAALTKWEEETLKVFRRSMASYGRVEKYWTPMLGIAPYLGTDFIASKVLYKVEDLLGARGPLAHPGRMLAQLVWKARRAEWPGEPLH